VDTIFVLPLAFPLEQLRRRPSACGREMGDFFNTLNKSLPRRSSKALEGQMLCWYYVCSYFTRKLRCVRTFLLRTFRRCSRVFAVQIVASATAWAMN